MVSASLRFFSIVFKIFGVGCWVFAFLLTKNVMDYNISLSGIGRSSFSEQYPLHLALAFLIPVATGVILFGVSFLLDIWLAIRINTQLLKSMKQGVK